MPALLNDGIKHPSPAADERTVWRETSFDHNPLVRLALSEENGREC